MTFKIVCDYDGETFTEGSVRRGTSFTLPPGWMNMNLYEGAAPNAPAPPPIFVVLCPACARAVQPKIK
jgi:hypothetical protein